MGGTAAKCRAIPMGGPLSNSTLGGAPGSKSIIVDLLDLVGVGKGLRLLLPPVVVDWRARSRVWAEQAGVGLLGEDRADGWIACDELGPHLCQSSWWSVDAGVVGRAEPGVEQHGPPPGGDLLVVGRDGELADPVGAAVDDVPADDHPVSYTHLRAHETDSYL